MRARPSRQGIMMPLEPIPHSMRRRARAMMTATGGPTPASVLCASHALNSPRRVRAQTGACGGLYCAKKSNVQAFDGIYDGVCSPCTSDDHCSSFDHSGAPVPVGSWICKSGSCKEPCPHFHSSHFNSAQKRWHCNDQSHCTFDDETGRCGEKGQTVSTLAPTPTASAKATASGATQTTLAALIAWLAVIVSMFLI